MRTRFPRLKAAVFSSERWENDDGAYSNLESLLHPKRSKPIDEVSPTYSGSTVQLTADPDPVAGKYQGSRRAELGMVTIGTE